MTISHWLIAVLITLGGASQAAVQPPQRAPGAAPGAAGCERLASSAVPNTRIVLAQSVPAGAFDGPPAVFSGANLSSFYKSLPAFCRIVAKAQPSADSDIGIEVWMPTSGWNGKLRGLGNGGFAGQMDYMQMGTAVKSGYAAAATDTGHTGGPVDASWAMGHPEKVIDFGHRAVHEMTLVAKALVRAFYGHGPERSYFAGCSDGGREALMEAQRYPADYDGILAGAPANDWTRLLTMSVMDSQALLVDPRSYIPPAKIAVIAAAVRDSCDEQDGLRDGIVNDPRQCPFDPARLVCHSGEADTCLTDQQASALRKLYDGPRDSKGKLIFPGYSPGAEEGDGGWITWITGPAPGKSVMLMFGLGYFSNMVYEQADWDFKTFTPEAGLEAAERKTAAALNATDANLEPFMKHGGKLLLYHGWADPAIPPLNTIRYYDSVVSSLGQQRANSFVRLFMIPGMQHCSGGPGPDWIGQDGVMEPGDPLHNANTALEQWVERGAAPAKLVATKLVMGESAGKARTTRLLCPHPTVARYSGSGDTGDAANFECIAAPAGQVGRGKKRSPR
ncbi:MAG TPA: tannase/feruloyl esterase family alpha/beta hydrolase [Bryobacteraceae bacterium]|nr:tannase/feruloyl esterase family alpha/beta hydrolase [Bryobacteraceae bacterium]